MAKRLAIAIDESGSNTVVASHFGGSSHIVIYNLNEDGIPEAAEKINNPFEGHGGGACRLPEYINQFDVDVVVAGGMGRKAITNFHSFDIEVITAPGLTPETALKFYTEGKLEGFEECEHSHGLNGHGHGPGHGHGCH